MHSRGEGAKAPSKQPRDAKMLQLQSRVLAYRCIVRMGGGHGSSSLCRQIVQFACGHSFVHSCSDLLRHEHLQMNGIYT